MKKWLLILAVIFFVPSASNLFAEEVNLFGYTFDKEAFSDDATLVSGNLSYYGFSKIGYPVTGNDSIDLPRALNGSDLYAHIEGEPNNSNVKSAYTVDVEFLDNYLFNGFGADLAIWERGQPEPMNVALFDPRSQSFTSSISFQSVNVGSLPDSVDVSPGVNVAAVDFSIWGIPEDVVINKIRLSSWGAGDPSPDIAAIGGLNSVVVTPEPASMLLFGLGGLAMVAMKKRKMGVK